MRPERKIELLDGCIAQLRELTAPDHALDARILLALRGQELHENSDPADGIFAFWLGEPWNSTCFNCSHWPKLTAELDDALQFVDEHFPAEPLLLWRSGTEYFAALPERGPEVQSFSFAAALTTAVVGQIIRELELGDEAAAAQDNT